MEQLLDLDPVQAKTPEGSGTLNLDADYTNAPVLNQDTLDKRATKYHSALGKDSPGIDSIKSTIINGSEGKLRDWAVNQQFLNDKNLRRDLITDYAKNRPQGELQPGEREFLDNLSTPELQSPQTVLEKKWADFAVNSTLAASKDDKVKDAADKAPDQFDAATNFATRVISQKELARAALEDVEASVGFMDQAKNFIPFYGWYQSTHAAPEDTSKSDAYLKGNVLEQQTRDMWLRTPEDFATAIEDIKSRALSGKINPENASELLRSIISYSATDKQMGNFQSYTDMVDVVPGVGITGDLIKGGVKAGVRVVVKDAVKKEFEEKAWTKPFIKGAETLPEDTFSSAEDYAKFVDARKRAQAETPKAGMSDAQYADKVNQEALIRSGKTIGKEIVDPETGKRVTRVVADTHSNRAQGLLDAAVENTSRNDLDPVSIHVTNGHTDEAAVDRITQLNNEFGDRMTRLVNGLVNPEAYLGGAERWSTRSKQAFLETMSNSANEGLRALFEGVQANRVTREQLERALPTLKSEFKTLYHGPDSGVLDSEWRVIHESENKAQVNYVQMSLGRTDGTLFGSRAEAEDTAVNVYKMQPGTFDVMQKGDGVTIRVSKAVDETKDRFRDVLIDTAHTTPMTAGAVFTQYLRSGRAFLSEAAVENRQVATHQASKIHEAMYEAAKEIGQVSKREASRLNQILELNRDTVMFQGTKEERKGFWYQNIGDFEQGYKNLFGDFPSEKVTKAYFTYRNMMDLDYIARNMKLYRDKSRMGFTNVTLAVPMKTLENGVESRTMQMWGKPIEGRLVDDVVKDEADKRIMILDTEKMEPMYIKSRADGLSLVDDYKAKGYQLIEVVNPDQRPLMAMTDNDNLVEYVLAKDFEQSPLEYVQIPYQEGGHTVVNANWKVSQPKIVTTNDGTKLHVGDRHFVFTSSEKEAQFWAERMEKARDLMLKGDDKALGDYVTRYTPYKSAEEFKGLFEPRQPKFKGDTDIEPVFQKDVPFVRVADKQGTNDAAKTYARDQLGKHFEGVVDTLDSPVNKYRLLDKKFAGQKSDTALTVTGSDKAAWNFQPARQISPLKTMQDSISNIMRNTALDNVQHQSVENFIQEFADVLDTPLDKLRQDPLEHLMNPEWNLKADANRLATAKAQRLATLQFLGMRTPTASTTDWLKNKLMNSVFDYGGKGAADFVDDHLLPGVKDPSQYIRAAAFHMKMGLFNPIQLGLQAQTMFHAMAITGNPARVATSMAATTLMSLGRMSNRPEVIDRMANIAGKLGWKPDQFKEMWSIAREQGLHVVAGEVGSLDAIFAPKLFTGNVGKFLDKGTMFFNEAERMVRLNAWATAYKEFRDVNPTKALTSQDIGKIMARQDTLSVNMTRASNAAWQNGVFSLPTQFMGYNARITEQLLGKQLTWGEKARVFGMYSALYGLPTGLGAATLYPWGDDIRREAISRGINIDDGALGALMNGLIATGVEWATGTKYNVGQRMGPGGITAIQDYLKGDKTVLDMIGGASLSILGQTVSTMAPAVADLVTGDVNALKQADFAHAFQDIATVSNTTKLLYALRSGKLMSKNGTILGPMSSTDAWVMFTTGLTPQQITDTYLKLDDMKNVRAAEQEMNKQFQRIIRRAMELPVGSPERKQLVDKAYSWMIDRDPGDATRLVHEVIKNEDLTTKTEKQYMKSGPLSARDARNKAKQGTE